MDKMIRKQFYATPTFDVIEQEFDEESFRDPGPGLARQATEYVLSPFYTRAYDEAMQAPTAQEEALAGALKPVPQMQIQALERRLEEEGQQSQQRLHEATAANKQSVNQQMAEITGEIQRATDLARATGAAASSTDDIQKNRGTQQWKEQLVAELRSARGAAAAAQSQVTTMRSEKQAFFEQQLENELEWARRARSAATN